MEEMVTLALDAFGKKVKLQVKLKPSCPLPDLSRVTLNLVAGLSPWCGFVFMWVNTGT